MSVDIDLEENVTNELEIKVIGDGAMLQYFGVPTKNIKMNMVK